MADGFLGRWSQRKQAVREGKPLVEPPQPPPLASAQALPDAPLVTKTQPGGPAAPSSLQVQAAEPPPPTLSLEDVKTLTAESDYAPFVSRSVSPEVRNAAMKKLFTDPHYNVMDRLDIYIDDYSLPDPLPEAMLRKMVSAKFLKLFDDDDEKDAKATSVGDSTHHPSDDFVAQSTPSTTADTASAVPPVSENLPVEPGLDHDHTDLRLQPNHAAGPQEPGRSTE